MNQPRTYRATVEAWLGQLLLPLAFFCLLAYTGINLAGLSPWLGGLGLGLVIFTALVEYVAPMLRNWLHLDSRSIEGSYNGNAFLIYWTEVLAAWLIERRRQKFLCIGTRDGTLVVPLRFFDDQAIWERVQRSVPPEALQPDAITRLPDYQELRRAGELAAREALEEAHNPTAASRAVADHWLFQVGGWAGMALFLFGALSAFNEGQMLTVAGLLLLAVGCGLLLVNWGLTEVGTAGITRQTLFTHHEILWDEVRSIEMDPGELVIVLTGEESRLVIPGPALWSGAGKKAALALLRAHAERHRIPLQKSMGAVFKTTKRSRR